MVEMRGYFGVGIDGVSKKGNVGNLVRTAHAFGASFAFAVNPKREVLTGQIITKDFANTAKSHEQIPFYNFETVDDLLVPKGCRLVGVEITDDAIDLPSFRHPMQAVYVLGGERTSLSEEMADRCDHMIKIPSKFSLNVATAGAIVMYDRMRVLGKFPERPVMAGRQPDPVEEHIHGKPISRLQRREKQLARNKGETSE
ncbi:rRNA methyltransferase [Kordiimonas sediminis]|uniref:rRNA methyltransferase n=1 Tax=Kordiimonas sediminis TaxID=1735581 RepID=A0A919ALW9_9PROT|nr:RNA methyltransferase [Kordiimonas sediminis]GHF14324.1 rRNA methyltransferase [Kordiimonas sediminis]